MNRPTFGPTDFTKSTYSDPAKDTCVGIARDHAWAAMRDTKQEQGSETDYHFYFPAADFDRFQDAIRTTGLKTAEFPTAALEGNCLTVERRGDQTVFRSAVPQQEVPQDAELVFTDGEIVAFFLGVHDGEFDGHGTHTAVTADCPSLKTDLTV